MQKPTRPASRAVVLPSLAANTPPAHSAPTESSEDPPAGPTPTVSQRHGELVRRLELLGKIPDWSQSGKSVRLADGLEHFEKWAGTILQKSSAIDIVERKLDKDYRKEIDRRITDRSRAISAPPTSDPKSFLKLCDTRKPDGINISSSNTNLEESLRIGNETLERNSPSAHLKTSIRDRTRGRASPKIEDSMNKSQGRELYDVLTPTRHTADKSELTRDISHCASFQSDKKLKDMIHQQLKLLDQIPLPSESSAVAFSFDLHESVGSLWQKIRTPSSKPASRTEVLLLEKWMNASLESCIDKDSGKGSLKDKTKTKR